MAVWQIITFEVSPGGAAAFVEGFAPIIAQVQALPGCERYELLVGATQPDRLVMVERWSDQASLDGALAALRPDRDDPRLAFLKLLVGPPHRERFEVP
jgi:quinol monooxygenase YgiN